MSLESIPISIEELIFGVASNLFVAAWLMLLVALWIKATSRWRARLLWAGGRLVPTLLLIGFLLGLILTRGMEPEGSIMTYDGMLRIFERPERTLNVWIEILALALFVTRWIIDHAETHSIKKWATTLVLFVAFISGGLGCLAYLLLVGIRRYTSQQAGTMSQ